MGVVATTHSWVCHRSPAKGICPLDFVKCGFQDNSAIKLLLVVVLVVLLLVLLVLLAVLVVVVLMVVLVVVGASGVGVSGVSGGWWVVVGGGASLQVGAPESHFAENVKRAVKSTVAMAASNSSSK